MWKNREEAERRLHALVSDFLDTHEESTDAEIDLGVLAIVAEIRERNTREEIAEILQQRRRPEAVYTPEAEWTHLIWYRCSDLRDWVAAGLFRRATLIAEDDIQTSYLDEDQDDKE